MAHLGYFRRAFVEQLGWLSEPEFAELIALAQSLPGPSSSQVGFGVGVTCGGLPGGAAAFAGFTLPSALLMTGFAYWRGAAVRVHALELLAVAVVAQAVVSMQRSLVPDAWRWALLLVGLGSALLLPPSVGTVAAMLAGAAVGALVPATVDRSEQRDSQPISIRTGWCALGLFGGLLLLALSLRGRRPDALSVWAALYRAGALVFGGGHVVLPLLEQVFPAQSWITHDQFLAGYGAAQALPGPLFTFSAFLGAVVGGPGLALLALSALFLPGLLLMTSGLAFSSLGRRNARAQGMLRGVNASVVGILLAALYQPLWQTAVRSSGDFLVVVALFAALRYVRL